MLLYTLHCFAAVGGVMGFVCAMTWAFCKMDDQMHPELVAARKAAREEN